MHPLERRVRTIVVGRLSFEDVAAHVTALRNAHALGYAELIDGTAVADPPLSYSDLWAVAQLVKDVSAFEHPGRRAIVVGGRTVYGFARLFEALVSGWLPVKAFRDQHAAEEWLAMPAPADVM